MKKSRLIQTQLQEIGTIQRLTSALEGVSSIRIAQIRDQVVPGRECFEELWKTYSQLRDDADKNKRFMDQTKTTNSKNQILYLVITSEGGLSGQIDQKIVDFFLGARESKEADILALGSRGAMLLKERGLKATKTYPLPDIVTQAHIQAIGRFIEPYASITVFYQSYESLGKQVVRTIDLINAVSALGSEAVTGGAPLSKEVISSRDYIFEPSLKEIIAIMESTMLQIALREVILDSRLAQLASRFSAMVAAEDKAKKRRKLLFGTWHKAMRDERDRLAKETTATGGAI
jgi:ATP synthase F1 gamma subunit